MKNDFSHLLCGAKTFALWILVVCIFSCSNDNSDNESDLDILDADEDSIVQQKEDDSVCENVENYIFTEKDGLVKIEFENAKFTSDWELKSEGNSFSGEGYMVWSGPQYLGQPGNGFATFRIRINNPGTYQFLWRSAVTLGNDGTEHNDTWLRFPDANDFFAQKGSSVVYPKGSGKIPHPEGASKDGWFKIYRSGNDLDFKWQSLTYDNNGHEIFVNFIVPGDYVMEVSARSSGHGIDQFVLFKDSYNKADAISETNSFSERNCGE